MLNKEGSKIMAIKFVSEKTKLPPSYLILGFLGVSSLILILGIFESLISRLVGVLYPAIASLYAIESPEKKDDK